MDKGKRIQVSSSTIVDLKAELYRKQEELKRNKGKQVYPSKSALKLNQRLRPQKDHLGKSNPGLAARLAKDKESQFIETDEDRDALAASRKKLEEKAKLYDKMLNSNIILDHHDEQEDCYMVDFQRKALENLKTAKETILHENPKNDDCYINPSEGKNEEWVDYTDSLGRSRKCLKTDLPKMMAMDLDLQSRQTEKSPTREFESDEEQTVDTEEFSKPDPTPLGPTHYQNVQFNEIRSHGVGYFAFSQSEEERKQQLDMLNQLRNQTKEQKDRREKLKEKRQAALKARLEKVKQRKRLKTGQALLESDSNSSDNEQSEIPTVIPEPPTTPSEENVGKLIEKPTTVRPWDRGKIGVSRVTQPFKKASQKEWVERRREERLSEFAPPQSYYRRDPVEEMLFFFKQQQAKHAEQQAASSMSSTTFPKFHTQNNTSTTNIDDIPLPHEYSNV